MIALFDYIILYTGYHELTPSPKSRPGQRADGPPGDTLEGKAAHEMLRLCATTCDRSIGAQESTRCLAHDVGGWEDKGEGAERMNT